MDLKKLFDEEMHGGPQIQGMQRRNGCYIDQKDDDSLHVLFDTGNLFIIRGSDVVQRIDANDEYFLDCKNKDIQVVEYALSRSLYPTKVAQYRTQLPDKKLLQDKLYELFDNNENIF